MNRLTKMCSTTLAAWAALSALAAPFTASAQAQDPSVQWEYCDARASFAAFSYTVPRTGEKLSVELQTSEAGRELAMAFLGPHGDVAGALWLTDAGVSGSLELGSAARNAQAMDSLGEVLASPSFYREVNRCLEGVEDLPKRFMAATANPSQAALFGIDCDNCWEDPATGQCVASSCACDGTISCFVLKVGCGLTGGEWGGWNDDECTWGNAAGAPSGFETPPQPDASGASHLPTGMESLSDLFCNLGCLCVQLPGCPCCKVAQE